MHARLVGKAEGGAVGIAGVVEIDPIVPADLLHRHFKGNSLRIEVARRMGAAGQGADYVGLRILGVGHNVDVGDGMVPERMAGRCGWQEFGQGAGESVFFEPFQESSHLAVGRFRRDCEADRVHVWDSGVDLEQDWRRFGIFNDRSGRSLCSRCLFVLGAGHDEGHKQPEPEQDAEDDDQGMDSGAFAFFVGVRLIAHDGVSSVRGAGFCFLASSHSRSISANESSSTDRPDLVAWASMN